LITFAFGRHCNAPLAAAASLLCGNMPGPASVAGARDGTDAPLRVGPLQ
jgi:hypothetical protein